MKQLRALVALSVLLLSNAAWATVLNTSPIADGVTATTLATVKPAATSATTSDFPLVVTISPQGLVTSGSTSSTQSLNNMSCWTVTALPTTNANGNTYPCYAYAATGAIGFDLSSIQGVALGAMANYGTSPGAVKVPGVNAFVTNTPTVTQTPATSGGVSKSSVIVPNNTTSVALKSSAGQLYGMDGFNISAATPAYIKFYDAAQGSTTCGSGTPVLRYMIPSNTATGAGFIMHEPNGIPFTSALTYCITAGIADTDTTAPAASTYVVNFFYK